MNWDYLDTLDFRLPFSVLGGECWAEVCIAGFLGNRLEMTVAMILMVAWVLGIWGIMLRADIARMNRLHQEGDDELQ